MLLKLLKHDFISLFKKISGVWLIFGVAFGFQILLADLLKMGDKADGMGNGIIMFFVVGGLSLAGFIISGYWFSSKMYGDEGYLTNTLPAKTWQIVLSKFIVATIVTIISGFFAILTAAIMASRMLDGFNGIWDLFARLIGEGWREFFQDWFIRSAIDLFLSTLHFLTLCFCAISLSNAIDFGNKTVKTTVLIIGGALIYQMLASLILIEEVRVPVFGSFGSVVGIYKAFSPNVFIGWAYTGAWIFVYFFATLFISEKHLKLRD